MNSNKFKTTPVVDLNRQSGSVTISKPLAAILGLDAATIFGELIFKHSYFYNIKRLSKDGYFYCVSKELSISTSLTDKRILKAVKLLEEHELIETTLRGMPRTKHYRLHLDHMENLQKLIEQGQEKIDEIRQGIKDDYDDNHYTELKQKWKDAEGL